MQTCDMHMGSHACVLEWCTISDGWQSYGCFQLRYTWALTPARWQSVGRCAAGGPGTRSPPPAFTCMTMCPRLPACWINKSPSIAVWHSESTAAAGQNNISNVVASSVADRLMSLLLKAAAWNVNGQSEWYSHICIRVQHRSGFGNYFGKLCKLVVSY